MSEPIKRELCDRRKVRDVRPAPHPRVQGRPSGRHAHVLDLSAVVRVTHPAENDAPTRCPNCGGPLTGASHQTVCLINATAEIERLRHPASSDPRTHGGNHSPLPYGVYLAPGFCAGCDQARVIPPEEGDDQ